MKWKKHSTPATNIMTDFVESINATSTLLDDYHVSGAIIIISLFDLTLAKYKWANVQKMNGSSHVLSIQSLSMPFFSHLL